MILVGGIIEDRVEEERVAPIEDIRLEMAQIYWICLIENTKFKVEVQNFHAIERFYKGQWNTEMGIARNNDKYYDYCGRNH